MDLRVIGVLLLVPLLDAMLLAVLATTFPLTLIIALVVLTALVGLLLVRAEGRRTLRKIQQKAASGEVPTDDLVDGGLLLVAGALFLTPGLVTDAAALLLALPPTRYPVRALVKRYVIRPYVDAKTGGFGSGNIYVGGFPNDGGPTAEADSAGEGTTVDIGEDEYRVDDEGDDRSRPGDS
ncbi:FxsA family protein [Halosegnis sp.]|uniref:FxsA family protein n=1 Tax=Halosegnis sp. TaxID=2864959 RepID=UPI0035D4DCBC